MYKNEQFQNNGIPWSSCWSTKQSTRSNIQIIRYSHLKSCLDPGLCELHATCWPTCMAMEILFLQHILHYCSWEKHEHSKVKVNIATPKILPALREAAYAAPDHMPFCSFTWCGHGLRDRAVLGPRSARVGLPLPLAGRSLRVPA